MGTQGVGGALETPEVVAVVRVVAPRVAVAKVAVARVRVVAARVAVVRAVAAQAREQSLGAY